MNHDEQPLPEEEFILLFNGRPVGQNELLKCKLSEFLLKIYYNCQYRKCEQKTESKFYYLSIDYDWFELFHYSSHPLQKNINKTFNDRERFNFDFPSNIFLKWDYLIYEEEKGIQKLLNPLNTKKNEFKSGFISFSSSILHEKNYTNSAGDTDMKLHTFITIDKTNNTSKYKRKKIGFLDVISKLGSLFSTIRLFFCSFLNIILILLIIIK